MSATYFTEQKASDFAPNDAILREFPYHLSIPTSRLSI